jgi:hypothetical protein
MKDALHQGGRQRSICPSQPVSEEGLGFRITSLTLRVALLLSLA